MRLIDSKTAFPIKTFAIDECLVRLRAMEKINDTLHFYVRKIPTVSLGYFKSIKDINLRYCKENKIAIFRRITGGGTIYTDEQQLIYSVVRSADKTLQKTIIKNCSAIICALKNLGISAEFKYPNDILVNNKKISGNAQMKILDISLQHGTILVDANFEKMAKVLKIKEEILMEKLTTIKNEIGRIKIDEVKKEIVKEFEKTFNARIERGYLKNFERIFANKLIKEKYSKDSWNFKR